MVLSGRLDDTQMEEMEEYLVVECYTLIFLSGLKWVLKITIRGIDEKLQCWTENKTDFKMKSISSCHVSKVMLSSNEFIMKYSFWSKDEYIMECKTVFQE